jgi:hypothetical protein
LHRGRNHIVDADQVDQIELPQIGRIKTGWVEIEQVAAKNTAARAQTGAADGGLVTGGAGDVDPHQAARGLRAGAQKLAAAAATEIEHIARARLRRIPVERRKPEHMRGIQPRTAHPLGIVGHEVITPRDLGRNRPDILAIVVRHAVPRGPNPTRATLASGAMCGKEKGRRYDTAGPG